MRTFMPALMHLSYLQLMQFLVSSVTKQLFVPDRHLYKHYHQHHKYHHVIMVVVIIFIINIIIAIIVANLRDPFTAFLLVLRRKKALQE